MLAMRWSEMGRKTEKKGGNISVGLSQIHALCSKRAEFFQ